jgi:hypothetical protein
MGFFFICWGPKRPLGSLKAPAGPGYMEFPMEDYLIVPIKLRQFPYETVRQLQAYSVRPFKVLKQGLAQMYVIDLLYDYGISLGLVPQCTLGSLNYIQTYDCIECNCPWERFFFFF